jgi:glycosyltransferase involved in cell wall biosynthesis
VPAESATIQPTEKLVGQYKISYHDKWQLGQVGGVKKGCTLPLRILMVVENASLKMGGESSKSIELFRRLRQKNINLWLICHARCRNDLKELFPSESDFKHIYFVEDSLLQVLLYRLGKRLQYRIRDLVVGQLIHLITQIRARKIARQIIKEKGIQLIFQPAPLAAKAVSCMHGLEVPLVVGPLCGNLELPLAFKSKDTWYTRGIIKIMRKASLLLHWVFPGKKQADTIIYSDQSALDALPSNCRGNTVQMLEPAVDTRLWHVRDNTHHADDPVRFIFLGRLCDWKGVEYLVEAFTKVSQNSDIILDIVGDGELREELETRVREKGLSRNVTFHGWKNHTECIELLEKSDVFIMPSLRESGGHAVLEAMALGLPVIVTNWGGPAHTVSPECGFLINPDSKKSFVNGLVEAMTRLLESPELRCDMGDKAVARIHELGLDWDQKCDRFIEIFNETIDRIPGKPRTELGNLSDHLVSSK